jgi:hypothetical protein
MIRDKGRKLCLIAGLCLVPILILGIAERRSIWHVLRHHGPPLANVVSTGNHGVDAIRGEELWGLSPGRTCSKLVQARDKMLLQFHHQEFLECRCLLDGALLWTGSPRSRPDYPEFAVAGNVVVAACDGFLHARALDSGTILWSVPRNEEVREVLPCPTGFLVWGGSAVDYHQLSSGARAWRKGDCGTRPVLLDDKDAILVAGGYLSRVRIEDGSEVWRRKAPGRAWELRLFPATPYVIWGTRDPEVPWTACLDAADGSTLWFSGNYAPQAAVLAPDHGHILVALHCARPRQDSKGYMRRDIIAALDTRTWTEAWSRFTIDERVEFICEGQRVFVGSCVPTCCGVGLQLLDIARGDVIWTADVRGIPTEHSGYSHEIELVRREGWISVVGRASAGDYVETFDTRTGKVISRWRSVRHDWPGRVQQ